MAQAWTLGKLASVNGETRARWSDMVSGAKRLQHAILIGGSHHEVCEAAKLMSRGWDHALHLRALGAWLIESFRGAPSVWAAINRTLRVEYLDGDERVTLNLTSS